MKLQNIRLYIKLKLISKPFSTLLIVKCWVPIAFSDLIIYMSQYAHLYVGKPIKITPFPPLSIPTLLRSDIRKKSSI